MTSGAGEALDFVHDEFARILAASFHRGFSTRRVLASEVARDRDHEYVLQDPEEGAKKC